jgi:4-hydroxybenzoate polyprenyltransferase
MVGAAVRVVGGLWRSSHPGPTLVVTTLAAALALASGVSPGRAALLVASVFAGQLSVGISNDALDAGRDRAVGRTDKPLARGDISVRTAWGGAALSFGAALAFAAPLGAGLLLAHAAFLSSAWAYNLGLKATRLSFLPYIFSFGLFPSLATLSAAEPQLAAPWAWVAGAALGAALHLTNVLPDLDDDARTGIRGLPHRMGGRISARIAAATLVVGGLAVTLGPSQGRLAEVPLLAWLFFGVVVLVAAVTVGLVHSGRSGRALFRLVMFAALVLAAQLVASGGSLAG